MSEATRSRNYLLTAVKTELGREYLTRLGYGDVLDRIDRGDDESTVTIAEQLRQSLHQSYAF